MDRLICDKMFVAVMETGSFIAASERMGTSSGQASKLISRLETELGVRLLARTTRAVVPTEVGQAYYERMRSLLEEMEDLDRSVRDAAQTPRGKLRITAPLTFGTLQLTPALNQFAGLYPEISLDVQFSDRVVNLVDEGFDAAIRVGRPADSGLIARKLCDMRVVVVAAPRYLSARGVPQVPQDLAHQDCIIDSNFKDPNLWRFDAPDGPVSVPVTGRLRYSNAEACLGAAEAGLGIAHVPHFIAADSLASGRVQAVLQPFEQPPYGVFVLYPPGRHLAAKVRVLVDFLVDRYRGDVDWAQPRGD